MRYKGWLNKKSTDIEEDSKEAVIQEEIKEEKEMGFFKKHPIVIGSLSGLAFLVAGFFIASKIGSDDEDEEFYETEDQDIVSEFYSDK